MKKKTAKKPVRKAVPKLKPAKIAVQPKLKLKPKKAKTKKKYVHSPDHYNKSETYLIQNLEEDLQDAWKNIREFGASLGEQNIYASGKAIMFSKKVCYFFVRPKKSYLEVVVFLKNERPKNYFKSIRPVSKTKYAHTFNLIHSDQIEGELIAAITQAYGEVSQA